MRTQRVFLVAVVVVATTLLVGAQPLLAQQTDIPQANTVQGLLLRVDGHAKTLTIRTASDIEMVFSYSDTTKVTGAGDTVVGLATLEGTDVKVTYTKRGDQNLASLVDVLKKPSA
jgi:hypothetical protein